MYRLGNQTCKQIIGDIRVMNPLLSDDVVPTTFMRTILNDAVAEFQEIAGIKDREEYKVRTQLTGGNTTEGIHIYRTNDNADGSAHRYNDTTRVLTVDLTKIAASDYFEQASIDVTAGLTQIKNLLLGCEIVLIGNTSGLFDFLKVGRSYIIDVPSNNTVKIANSVGFSFTSEPVSNLEAVIKLNGADTTIDLSTAMSDFKQIDVITEIEDDINGVYYNANNYRHFKSIKKPGQENENYSDSVVWVRENQYLEFYKGTSVASFGTRVMHWIRKPYPMNNLSDIIDVKPSNIKQIKTIATYLAFKAAAAKADVKVPSDVSDAYTLLMKAKEAGLEEKASSE